MSVSWACVSLAGQVACPSGVSPSAFCGGAGGDLWRPLPQLHPHTVFQKKKFKTLFADHPMLFSLWLFILFICFILFNGGRVSGKRGYIWINIYAYAPLWITVSLKYFIYVFAPIFPYQHRVEVSVISPCSQCRPFNLFLLPSSFHLPRFVEIVGIYVYSYHSFALLSVAFLNSFIKRHNLKTSNYSDLIHFLLSSLLITNSCDT